MEKIEGRSRSDIQMTTEWRLLRSGEGCAAWNMGVDEAIYRLILQDLAPPTLRLFRWRPSAVSIGRFQNIELPEIQLYLIQGYPLVRRPTGGLAVLHGSDLSYSIVGRVDDGGLPVSRRVLYRRAHEALKDALESVGIALDLYSGTEERSTAGLCSAVPMRSDLMLHRGEKIGGSAQVRSGNTVLQHGCVHIPCSVDYSRFEWAVATAFERHMGLRLIQGTLSAREAALAASLAQLKYKCDKWNLEGLAGDDLPSSSS